MGEITFCEGAVKCPHCGDEAIYDQPIFSWKIHQCGECGKPYKAQADRRPIVYRTKKAESFFDPAKPQPDTNSEGAG